MDENEKYELISLFGKPALFTNERLTRKDVPDLLFLYHIRGRDDDCGAFGTLEPFVAVNHAGSVITDEPIDFGEDGYIAFEDENFPAFIGEQITIAAYMNGEFETEDVEDHLPPRPSDPFDLT